MQSRVAGFFESSHSSSYYWTSGGSRGQRGGTDIYGNPLAFSLPDDQCLMRFLILGTESSTYYATETTLREENAVCVTNLINSGQGEMVVEKVVEVVKNGRTTRMNAPLLTLAMCCRSNNRRTKSAAYRAILDVCNIPTHLFKLVQLLESHGKSTGWGRGLRKAMSLWYNQFANNPQRLAMLVTKYRQRQGWSHRDLLRLAHLKPVNDVTGFILRYVVKGLDEAKQYYLEDGKADIDSVRLRQILAYLNAVEEIRYLEAPTEQENADAMEADNGAVERVVALIQQFDLLREHVHSSMLNRVEVWQSLLEKMPVMATVRNLPKMTALGLLSTDSAVAMVVEKLNNKAMVKNSKVHPYAILLAWYTYRKGRGVKSKLTWKPVPEVLAALEAAFYAAFGNVTPTNKRMLLALDVSESMNWQYPSMIISPRVGSVAMCMVTLAVEPNAEVVAFSDGLIPVAFQRDWTLGDMITHIETIPMGNTDCSLPMRWAMEKKKEYDAFVIYTDNETWYSQELPAHTLKKYRKEIRVQNARMVTVAMTVGGYVLADPADLYMMDVVGFDAETPAALHEFLNGSLFE